MYFYGEEGVVDEEQRRANECIGEREHIAFNPIVSTVSISSVRRKMKRS
jgi:hypothetical protein